jgi:ribosomal protein L7/L12
MESKKQARLVKAIWQVMEAEGVGDAQSRRRCEEIVSEFVSELVQAIHDECNGPVGDVGVSARQMVPIRKALRENKKILAIKLYREVAAVDLATAKDAMDRLDSAMRG